MLTDKQITDAAAELVAGGHVSGIHQRILVAAVKSWKGFSPAYEDVAERLAQVTGAAAQICVATLKLIQAAGFGTERLTGGLDAIDYSKVRDRDELIRFMLSTMYEDVSGAGVIWRIPVYGGEVDC